jgi:predicted kinase
LHVVADATFLRRADRDAFRALAAKERARLVILDCAAPLDALRHRVAARLEARHDASEATLEVLDEQLRRRESLTAEERRSTIEIDTAADVDVEALRRRLLGPPSD